MLSNESNIISTVLNYWFNAMKDIVFIGWSSSRDLAIAVKKLLDGNGYIGVIGGDHEGNPSALRGIHDTVIATIKFQMDKCNQAIVLLTEHGKTDRGETALSSNLCFEMGYLTAKFGNSSNSAKLHIFNIGVSISSLPSDIQGMWDGGANINAAESIGEKAEKIVYEFLRRQQLASKDDYLIYCNNYHLIDYEIANHTTTPLVSDRVIALQAIFYVQSSYMFNDVSNAAIRMELFENEMRKSYEMSSSFESLFEFARLSLSLFLSAVPKDVEQQHIMLEDRYFRSTKRGYIQLVEELASSCNILGDQNILLSQSLIKEHEFEALLIIQIQQHLTFLYLIYLDNPNLSEEVRQRLVLDAISICLVNIDNLNLLANFPYGKLYANILLGFCYHNLSMFYSLSDNSEGKRDADAMALKVRRYIYKAIKNRQGIHQELKSYFELEYFFQLLEDIENSNDMEEKLDDCDEIDDYIHRILHQSSVNNLTFSRLVQKFQEVDCRK